MPLDPESITLRFGEQVHGVAIDWRHQLRDFCNVRLPSEDILFARWIKPDVPNPLSCGNAPEYLTPPYPALPPIAIGELQWPTGASRYARALYAVDWEVMRAVAEYAWGWEVEHVDPETPEVLPTDVPEAWGSASNYLIRLSINSDSEGTFACSMRVLPPYRVTGDGIDLWLLPLVDSRFEGREKVRDSSSTPPEDWTTFLTECGNLVTGSFCAIDAVDGAYGSVDPRLYKTVQPQRAAQLLDVGALSVGRRVVVDPSDGTLRALNSTNSTARRDQRIAAKSTGELLSGGLRGVGSLPPALDAYCQRKGAIDKKSAFISGGTIGFARLPIYTTWESTLDNVAATNAFVAKLATDVAAWSNSGGQSCYVGAFDYLPSGFDDYLSIQILETEPEKYVFRSRIYELPNVFLPTVVLAGGLEPECQQGVLFKFILLENMAAGLDGANVGDRAKADIYKMTGEQVESEYPVENSLSDFSDLVYGDDGLCIKVDDKYWIIHPEGPGGGGGSATWVKFTLSADLTSTATATVQTTSDAGVVAVSDSITVSNYSGQAAYAGAIGTAVSFDEGTTWFVVEVNRRPNFYEIELTCDSHAWSGSSDTTQGFAADRTDPITYTLNLTVGSFPLNHTHDYENLPTIKNPRNHCWVSGDNALVERVNDSEYRVVKVLRQNCLRFRFLISSDVPTGQNPDVTATAISPLDGESGEPPSGTLTLKDRYGKAYNGKSGQKGIACYDFNRQEHFVEECWTTATVLVGLVNATQTGMSTSTDIVVKSCVGMNGISPSGTVNVRNVYNWSTAVINQPIEFYWHPVNGRYEGRQMQCDT